MHEDDPKVLQDLSEVWSGVSRKNVQDVHEISLAAARGIRTHGMMRGVVQIDAHGRHSVPEPLQHEEAKMSTDPCPL